MSRHEKYMQEAKICSYSSSYHQYKIGCVLVLKNGKRYFGFNHDKSHPLQKKFNANSSLRRKRKNSFIHAEMHAIVSCLRFHDKKEIENSSIYIYRTPNDKREFANCRPCDACMSAIKHFKISNIYYTSDDSNFVHERMEK